MRILLKNDTHAWRISILCAVIIGIVLFFLPFFWLTPPEMDLGGDSSRLYFYDPVGFMKAFSLYAVEPHGVGSVESNHYAIPYFMYLWVLKWLFQNSTLVVSVTNGITLLGGYLSVLGVVYRLLQSTRTASRIQSLVSATVAGVLYILMPTATGNWDKALLSHTQVFMNPFMFFLLLSYVLTNRRIYLVVSLFMSIVYSVNFGFTSAPAIFSFYPLASIFLFVMCIVFGWKVRWKDIFIFAVSFFFLHAFHIIPQVVGLLDPGSFANTRVFDKKSIIEDGVRYFYGVLPYASVAAKVALAPLYEQYVVGMILVPGMVVVAWILGKKSMLLRIVSFFFIITLFLLTAKITNFGIRTYASLFYLPGFSMFRNFIGQWLYVFSFFYAVLFGISVGIVAGRTRVYRLATVLLTIFVALTITSRQFITGEFVRNYRGLVEDKTIPIVMDSSYEKLLSYLRGLGSDTKILTLPFTDSYYQVVRGTNGGVYIGLPPISFLTGKRDFPGYSVLTTEVSDALLSYARSGDYGRISSLLTLMNVGIVVHNTDPFVYEKGFSGWPYSHVLESMPKTQASYGDFISRIGFRKETSFGTYDVYVREPFLYAPHVFIADTVLPYGKSFEQTMPESLTSTRTAYIDTKYCTKDLCTVSLKVPTIKVERINPTRYLVHITNIKGDPFLLVFSDMFHAKWQLHKIKEGKFIQSPSSEQVYFDGQVTNTRRADTFFSGEIASQIREGKLIPYTHIRANGYANAWVVTSSNTEKEMWLVMEMVGQRVTYVSLAISFGYLFLLSIVFVFWIKKRLGR